MRILYRKLRRKNYESAEAFMKQEFFYSKKPTSADEPRMVPDLDLSVFEVHRADDIRTVAEYHGITLTKVSASVVHGLDLDDRVVTVIAVDDEGLHFDHLRETHREVRLADEEALREFAERVYNARKRIDVKRSDIYDYMASQMSEDDQEWGTIFERADRAEFKKQAERKRAKSS